MAGTLPQIAKRNHGHENPHLSARTDQLAIVLGAVKTKPSAAEGAGLDGSCARRRADIAAGAEECSAGAEQKNGGWFSRFGRVLGLTDCQRRSRRVQFPAYWNLSVPTIVMGSWGVTP